MEKSQLAIHIRNLLVSYPNTGIVMKMEDWSLPSGSKHFLYGPSGSGKSTLLSLLAGILAADTGEVHIQGTRLDLLSPTKRDRFRGENIGYIFQQFNLIPYLTVRENIRLPLDWNPQRKKRIGSESIEASILHLTKTLRIDSILDNISSRISVGQAQRVAVARALLGSPPLILADEPTSALDEETKSEFLRLLFTLVEEQGATLLFVSHDKSLIPLFDASTNLPDINRRQNSA